MIHDKHSDSCEKTKICHDYIKALEEERRKVLVFQRELPLCLDLVTQAIEACKQQLSGATTDYHLHGQSESSEQTSDDDPILEPFIPIEKLGSLEKSDYRGENPNDEGCCNKDNCNNTSNKSDWLRSAQLWNQTPDPAPIQEGSAEKINDAKEVSYHPCTREKINLDTQPLLLPASTSSTAETGDRANKRNKKEEKEGKSSTLKKERRCWSPELHRRFLQALQQLGGSHATPKQIRELMKVDGLTNDEVKSHLQKYRLHTRRPTSSASITTTTTAPQPPQFVVVGGIWVPPEYSVLAKSGDSSYDVATHNGIYATIPSILPGNFKASSESPKLIRKSWSPHSDDCNNKRASCSSHSDSPGTSSSTHTTTSAY